MMGKKIDILLLEDNPDDVMLLEYELNKADIKYNLRVVDTKDEFITGLVSATPDIILSDHTLPAFNSMIALSIKNIQNPEIPFILVTGSMSEEFAVECMKAGADDYILKSSLTRLPSAIQNVLSKDKIKKEKSIIEKLHYELKIAFVKIEQQNKEILDSIAYAKRLQDALLPSSEEIHLLLKEYFIFYKPLNIVSGDFYFIEPIKTAGNKKLTAIAVADCTGHGVPGAFMSMLGYDILKNSLGEKSVNSAADALNYLNSKLSKILRASSTNQIVRDGMDIAFCVLDEETLELQYSGANRPCWIIKKDKKIITLNPDKQPIGYSEKSDRFNQRTIQLEKGDMLYLFTDGYIDQFGGPKGKKIKKRLFREKLLSIHNNKIKKQEEILETMFNHWRGDLEQVDDILVLGIRI
jgi:serine phosphatase RsbU (regulator of sigma subunit)